MYKQLEIYNELFSLYKTYIMENCIYNPNIRKKTPQSFSRFPTIIFKESVNINDSITTNKQEFIDQISYTIDIYTKDMTIDGKKYASEDIMRDLQYLTFEFMKNMKMDRVSCEDAEYLDYTIDRKFMIFNCLLKNWDKKII